MSCKWDDNPANKTYGRVSFILYCRTKVIRAGPTSIKIQRHHPVFCRAIFNQCVLRILTSESWQARISPSASNRPEGTAPENVAQPQEHQLLLLLKRTKTKDPVYHCSGRVREDEKAFETDKLSKQQKTANKAEESTNIDITASLSRSMEQITSTLRNFWPT